MKLHAESHLDHSIPDSVRDFLLVRFQDREAFFVETITLPDHLPSVSCGLYGPIMGDAPVPESEVYLEKRGARTWTSRLCRRPSRLVRQVTIIAGPHDGQTCIVYTIFGGPLAPKETGDSSGSGSELSSERFWAEHALAVELRESTTVD